MSNDDQGLNGSKFFFPLRTNVGYFDAPDGYFSLIERIKQASLLFDELIFEAGIYLAIAGEGGKVENVLEYDPEYADIIMGGGTGADKREPFVLLQPKGGEPLRISLGPNARQFRSEFHSTLRKLGAENLSWINITSFEPTDIGKEQLERIRKDFEPLLDEVASDAGRYLKRLILSGLSRDIMLTSAMRASASMNAMYAPMLHRKAQFAEAKGFMSIEVAVPNWSQVGWDVILDLRKEESLVRFRQMLSSLEDRFRAPLAEGDAAELRRQLAISKALNRELLREVADLLPRVGELIGNAGLDLVLSPVPILGTIVNALRYGAKLEDVNRSWIAAFLRLNPPDI
jgi:hypothetical protein